MGIVLGLYVYLVRHGDDRHPLAGILVTARQVNTHYTNAMGNAKCGSHRIKLEKSSWI